jgi:hypothetical protein
MRIVHSSSRRSCFSLVSALLGWIESHTGVRKLYLASAFSILALLLIFRGTGMSLFTVLVGFLYPLHMSLKTIENCTSLFEAISGENRNLHTEEEVAAKREDIVGQLRKWFASHILGCGVDMCVARSQRCC